MRNKVCWIVSFLFFCLITQVITTVLPECIPKPIPAPTPATCQEYFTEPTPTPVEMKIGKCDLNTQLPNCALYNCNRYANITTEKDLHDYIYRTVLHQELVGVLIQSIKAHEITDKCSAILKEYLTGEFVCCLAPKFKKIKHNQAENCEIIELEEGNVGCLKKPAYEFKDPDSNTPRYVRSYLGIPYAEPPIGNLRFRPPKSLSVKNYWGEDTIGYSYGQACIQECGLPWNGCYCDESQPTGFLCSQPGIIGDCYRAMISSGVFGDEDCLNLNVWVPTTQPVSSSASSSNPNSNPNPSNALLPVYVFIHGGSFSAGTSSIASGAGDKLAAEGIITVTFNYRLNSFGYMADPDEGFEGNYGHLDQIMALKWVKKNIHKFGGDPNQITIAGESAGGTAVIMHLCDPESKPLFNKVIIQSAPHSLPFHHKKLPELTLSEFYNQTGCLGFHGRNLTNCLNKKCSNTIYAATRYANTGAFDSPLFSNFVRFAKKASPSLTTYAYNFGPVIDGIRFKDQPFVMMTNQIAPFDSSKPILMGFNEDEGTMFARIYWMADRQCPIYSENDVANYYWQASTTSGLPLTMLFEFLFGGFLFRVIKAYPPDALGTDPFNNFMLMEMLFTDMLFKCPMKHSIKSFPNVDKLWLYNWQGTYPFDIPWRDSCAMRSCHAGELAYVFGYVAEVPAANYTFEISKDIGLFRNVTREGFQSNPLKSSSVYQRDYDWLRTLSFEDLISMRREMMTYWVNFVKTGDPNLPTPPPIQWKPYSQDSIMHFDYPSHLSNTNEVNFTICDLWDDIGYFW